jgi:exodeoxyribonuclease V alpha subunit
LLAAPTGKAAKRMSESTGMPGARTIHSVLALNTDESESKVVIDAGLVIIDEMSMVDLRIAYKLLKSVESGSRIVFVGDADQLPSVGAGNVFFDILCSECVPVTRLDTVFRQTGTSRIAINAEQIRLNDTKLLYGSDFNFIDADSDTQALEILKHCYVQEVKTNGIDNVQVLAPFRARGETSVKNINEVIRDIVNPFTGEHNELCCDGNKLRNNDRVIQLKNINGINNGDVGFIRSIYRDEDEIKHAIIEFSDGVRVDYSERELDIVDLAYATTIHKSQGSEYSTVIIPIMMSHCIMLKRNLIYTAITRAKKKVILIGEKRALMAGIHKNDSSQRNTKLSERIKMYVREFSGEDDTK